MLRFLWANRAPIVISGALGLASDVTCQLLTQDMVVETERLLFDLQNQDHFDYRRSARFASIWLGLVAPLNLGWFHLLARRGIAPLKCVLLDQLCFYPALLSAIITTNQLVAFFITGESNEVDLATKARESIDLFPIALCYWVPVQYINYNMVPLHMRLIYVQCAAFMFNVYMSMRLN